MMLAGTVIENSVNRKGDYTSVIELDDPNYKSVTQRLIILGQFKLNTEVSIVIEALGEVTE